MDGSKINPISVARRGQQAGQINDIAERNGRTKVIIIINGTKKKKAGIANRRDAAEGSRHLHLISKTRGQIVDK